MLLSLETGTSTMCQTYMWLDLVEVDLWKQMWCIIGCVLFACREDSVKRLLRKGCEESSVILCHQVFIFPIWKKGKNHIWIIILSIKKFFEHDFLDHFLRKTIYKHCRFQIEIFPESQVWPTHQIYFSFISLSETHLCQCNSFKDVHWDDKAHPHLLEELRFYNLISLILLPRIKGKERSF